MKLNIIFGVRNDGFGDSVNSVSYLDKIKYSIESTHRSLRNIDYKITMIDINPPPDRPLVQSYFIHPRVEGSIFTREQMVSHIEKLLDAGMTVNTKSKVFSREEILNSNYNFLIAFYYLLPTIEDEYILLSCPDTIFTYGFDSVINSLKPNILYRCLKKNIYESNYQFNDDLLNRIMNKEEIDFVRQIDGNNPYKSTGDFMLADTNSWKEIGSFLPFPYHFMPNIDGFQMYLFLAYKKKILNIKPDEFHISQFYSNREKGDRKIDVSIRHKGEYYSYSREMNIGNYKMFKRWAENHMSFNGCDLYTGSFEYFKERHEKNKKIFLDLLGMGDN